MSQVLVKMMPWGNSYGLRVRKADAARLGLKPGQELAITIPDFAKPIDISHWPRLDFGGGLSARHDEEGFDPL